jgi:hypothetical protein
MAPVLEAVRFEDLTPRLGDDDEGGQCPRTRHQFGPATQGYCSREPSLIAVGLNKKSGSGNVCKKRHRLPPNFSHLTRLGHQEHFLLGIKPFVGADESTGRCGVLRRNTLYLQGWRLIGQKASVETDGCLDHSRRASLEGRKAR